MTSYIDSGYVDMFHSGLSWEPKGYEMVFVSKTGVRSECENE